MDDGGASYLDACTILGIADFAIAAPWDTFAIYTVVAVTTLFRTCRTRRQNAIAVDAFFAIAIAFISALARRKFAIVARVAHKDTAIRAFQSVFFTTVQTFKRTGWKQALVTRVTLKNGPVRTGLFVFRTAIQALFRAWWEETVITRVSSQNGSVRAF